MNVYKKAIFITTIFLQLYFCSGFDLRNRIFVSYDKSTLTLEDILIVEMSCFKNLRNIRAYGLKNPPVILKQIFDPFF